MIDARYPFKKGDLSQIEWELIGLAVEIRDQAKWELRMERLFDKSKKGKV